MSWFVICHNPEDPKDTTLVNENEYTAYVFPDEKSAEIWIAEREREVPFYEYRAIEF